MNLRTSRVAAAPAPLHELRSFRAGSYRASPRAADLHEVVQELRAALRAVQDLEELASRPPPLAKHAVSAFGTAWYVFGLYSKGLGERTKKRLSRIFDVAQDRLMAALTGGSR